jgi:O-antigen/teichoic acid export membrane protein
VTIATPFARRIAGVFATRVVRFVLGFATSFLLARILGPSGRGAYYLVSLTPTTLATLGQFGLPSAMSFFAGRGRSTRGLQVVALFLSIGLSLALLLGTLAALPWLEQTILKAAPDDLLRLALFSLPFQFLASFAGAILIGRQVMRNYNVILVLQSVLTLVLIVLLVGVLGMGVFGAVLANLILAGAAAAATMNELRRLNRGDPDAAKRPVVRVGELVAYGAKIYPASITSFFSYRADVFLLSALLGDPRPIGLYSLAVSMAELTFFVPDSVSTVFFPHVAGSERRDADSMAPVVTRFTVLITSLSVLGLIPAAFAAVYLIVPNFSASIPAFLIIMPGIVALSISKILSSYIGGLGMPLRVALASGAALILNLAANLILIPIFGFVGAAIASLISYSAHAIMLVTIASGLSRRPALSFLIPTRAEWTRLISGIREVYAMRRASGPPTEEGDRG